MGREGERGRQTDRQGGEVDTDRHGEVEIEKLIDGQRGRRTLTKESGKNIDKQR